MKTETNKGERQTERAKKKEKKKNLGQKQKIPTEMHLKKK